MPEPTSYENRWNDLLKASRAWQLQWDLQQLLTAVSKTAVELLSFEQGSAFVLESGGLVERGCWPNPPAPGCAPETERRRVAQNVVQAGRSAFVQQVTDTNPGTALCAPLTASREIMGAIYLETRRRDRQVTLQDQQFFDMLAVQAAGCLEHVLLYQSAITDALTKLFCHRYFQQEIDQAVRRATRNERPVSLLLMDLDHFKTLNDTCGHEVGNECLLEVASILRATFRSTDTLARFGGDEFEILLPDTALADAAKVAEQARARIEALKFPSDIRISATIGVAEYPQNAADPQTLFLTADDALYAAKEAGRNRVQVALPVKSAKDSNKRMAARAKPLTQRAEPAPAQPPQPGRMEMIDGHVVLKRLGVGSTGEVLLVMQPGLEREVALKRPLTPHLSFEQTQSFEQEAKITASLDHPGVVPIFTIGRDSDARRYYTMKPLRGRSLGAILDGRRKGEMETLHAFSLGRLLEILQRVSETIAHAHLQNVLHLDLTPENILVGDTGEVTVIDWATGASRSRLMKPSPGGKGVRLIGSSSFVAPELLSGNPEAASAASDVFVLGSLLYYLLTDTLPFQRNNTQESIEALLKGELAPPEKLRPDGGIEPALSKLALQSLARDPEQRPTALEFRDRLARYLRRELDWTTIRLGKGGQPLKEDEWLVERGRWKICSDEWVTEENDECILCWKLPIPASFHFICEAWFETGGELSLIGHRPPPANRDRWYSGYFFQFGCEYGRLTKLARHENDCLVIPQEPLKPGKRYLLELQYNDQEGMLRCAIDGRRIFSYRELFPFSGSMLGFYTCASGVHFRPIEVRRQNWSLQIPALRAADRYFQHKHFAEAREVYAEIAENAAERLEGAEATLKLGLCEAALGQLPVARAQFRRIAGTALEPFALAEEALLDVSTREDSDLQRSIDLFNDLIRRFPASQARIGIIDASRDCRWSHSNYTRTRTLELQIELHRLAKSVFQTPSQTLFHVQSRLSLCHTWLGRWEEALAECLAFKETLLPTQRDRHELRSVVAYLALAVGREDLVNTGPLRDNPLSGIDWWTGLELHRVVRFNTAAAELDAPTEKPLHFLFWLQLAAGRLSEAAVTATKLYPFLPGLNTYMIGNSIADTRCDELMADFVRNCEAQKIVAELNVTQARYSLEGVDFESAARRLTDFPPPSGLTYFREGYLLQLMLASLGYLKSPSLDKLRAEHAHYLSGTMLDMAEMFLELKPPVPGKLWPHPGWRPEWRLWLALWLEAKGRRKEAHAIAAPSRDPRYGLTHCQPSIEALLKRTTPS